MTAPWLDDGDVRVYVGDVRAVLAGLPDESVDCVITSPPYWGLRDYGASGQLGLEATPDLYVANMVAVFREVRRVLAPHGTCWLNLAPSYFGNPGGPQGATGQRATRTFTANARAYARGSDPNPSPEPERALAYGSGGTAPQGSPDPGSACLGLCDGCLDDFRSHRDRTAGTLPPAARSPQPDETTIRGSAPADSVPEAADVEPPASQESTPPVSSPPPPGVCWRCGTRPASAFLQARLTDEIDVPASAHTAGYTSGTAALELESHSQGTDASGTAWVNYTRSLKSKDLVATPWMVAMALQMDGWYLRSEICWSKSNPMPESVTDRPTKSHEQVFLLAKRPSYWFDQEAVREPMELASEGRYAYAFGGAKAEALAEADKDGIGFRTRTIGMREATAGRNVRSVWNIATQPFAEAHFATFPEELVRRCLLAGCPVEVCSVCGAPRERIVEVERVKASHAPGRGKGAQDFKGVSDSSCFKTGLVPHATTVGWSDCGHNAYRPGRVLDPFLGSGTTALVARHHGRHAIGVELNEEYAEIAARRLQQLSLLAEDTPAVPEAVSAVPLVEVDQVELPAAPTLTGGAYSPPGQSPHSNARG